MVEGEWLSSPGDIGEWPVGLEAPSSGTVSSGFELTAVVSIVMVGLHRVQLLEALRKEALPSVGRVTGMVWWCGVTYALGLPGAIFGEGEKKGGRKDYVRITRTLIRVVNKVQDNMALQGESRCQRKSIEKAEVVVIATPILVAVAAAVAVVIGLWC